ncbi:MAG: FAD-dependent oxidoreductase [Gammaproteobacteria bacterium]
MSNARSLKTITSKTHPMSHIAIAGAGPSGLFLAIRLKQLGIKNVVVVDPRAGTYSRSTDFHPGVFAYLSMVLQIPIPPSIGFHIKDVERILFGLAKDFGVVFHRQSFTAFSKKRKIVLTSAESKEQTEIPCDILFDCTGTKRVIIKKANESHPNKPKFMITPIKGNPHKTHLFARGVMDSTLSSASHKRVYSLPTPGDSFDDKQMQEFRKLGWKQYAAPDFYINEFDKKNKVTLYTQAPEDLKSEDQLKFINTVVSYATRRENINFQLIHESKKYPDKARVSVFNVEPAITTPDCDLGDDNFPLIFPAGDAFINIPFRKAHSLKHGADRIEALLDSLRIENGEITGINLSQYKDDLQKLKAASIKSIQHHFLRSKKRFDTATKNQRLHYQILWERGFKNLKQIKDKKTGIAIDKISALQECIESLLKVRQMPEFHSKKDLTKIDASLWDIAKCSKQAATFLCSIKNYSLASLFYRKALDIYSTCFAGRCTDEITDLCSQLKILSDRTELHTESAKTSTVVAGGVRFHFSPKLSLFNKPEKKQNSQSPQSHLPPHDLKQYS